jgi:hypothetical protein
VSREWADVPGFPGYQVSRRGQVRSLKKGRILKPFLGQDGYLHLNLWRDGRPKHHLVHRVVASAWLGGIPEGYQVNHKNGIKTDNRLENLEVVTPQENLRHARLLGLAPSLEGEANYNAKLSAEQVREVRRLRKEGSSVSQLARRFELSETAIFSIVTRKSWKHLR